ncbi:MobF family relaxase [Pseudonocardia sp. Cha107L01]|uniref:MobF family relaxase n=1 Tax=Pseudonocardia sp. Cha107L01 TaxID=3457576 RepID=UPI00403EA7CA
MAGVLTISSGHSADYLLKAVATGRENYYTGAVAEGEPPGRWYGTGAAALGLAGEVGAQDMTALFEHFVDPSDPAFHDPAGWDSASKLGHAGRRYLSAEAIYERSLEVEPHADAQRREQLRVEASQAERKNVAFLDATFSVPKSVTVLHTAFEAQEVAATNAGRLEEAAAWGQYRQAIEDAMWAGNNASLDYLAQHAGYTRVGHHGGAAGRFVDAHDWVVASFLQHDSRDQDPQLHIHNPILNRVQGPDGQWRTLDSRAIHKFRGAAGAIGERVMEGYVTATVGLRFATRADGKAREIVGVPRQVMDLFSSRSRAIGPKQAALVAEFEAQFGRAPNRLERDRLARSATFATRRAKAHEGTTRAEQLQRWSAQLRAEIRGDMATLAHDAIAAGDPGAAPMTWSPLAVLQTALAAVQEKKAAWTPPDLTREISAALPDHLGITDPGEMIRLHDWLTTEGLKLAVPLDAARPGEDALPDELRRADGESVYQAPGARLYATPEHIHTERVLVAATTARGAAAMGQLEAARFFDQLSGAGIELGADQAAAVRGLLTSGARLESLIGPAGTGKSFVVGTLATAWQDPTLWGGRQQRAFGLATAQIAADVLAGEGLNAANTAAWLAAQDRLAAGRGSEADQPWVLRGGDLVVVDESSMADTTALDAVRARVEAAGAKMVPTGDFHQLGAIGAGGALEMLAGAGTAYELTDARRFHQQWEREASLRLRAGDTGVLEEYHRHGRIIDGGTAEQAERLIARRWLGDTLAGKHALLIVDTNEQAGRINADLRAELVKLGRVTEDGVRLEREGTTAGVGDLVRAKHLARDLLGYQGNTSYPVTHKQYRVLSTNTADGSMVVAPIETTAGSQGGETLGRAMTLPASYVAADMTLGYAVTGHGAEGVTVDTGYPIATPTTWANALYPNTTRGRESNTIVVVTQSAPHSDAATGEVAQALRKDPRAVLANILETARRDQSALAEAHASAVETANVKTPGELFADAATEVATARTAGWLDELTAAGTLTAEQRARLAAEDGSASLGRMLRRVELAGHDPRAVLTEAITRRDFDGARQLTNVIHQRIVEGPHALDPTGHTYRHWTPATERQDWGQYLGSLAAAADARAQQLGADAVADPPTWAVAAFGPVPDDPAERQTWQHRAAVVASHRELSGHDDPDTAIGAAPAPGLVEAHASWRAAWRALGRPETGDDEATMTDGRLRMRVRAYEREQTWVPRRVTNELGGTIQARDHQRSLATRRDAEAAAAATGGDASGRDRLRREAAEARALADTLDTQIGQLEEADEAFGMWLAHTAGSRAASDRAQLELANRRALDEHPEPQVTAAEWMAAHAEAMRTEDAYRPITDEADLLDTDARTERSTAAAEDTTARTADGEQDGEQHGEHRAAGLGQPDDRQPRDLREIAAAEDAPADEHTVHVPTVDQTSASLRRAHRALTEITVRDAEDQARAEYEARAEELARWHADQHAERDADERGTERAAVDDTSAGGPVLESSHD